MNARTPSSRAARSEAGRSRQAVWHGIRLRDTLAAPTPDDAPSAIRLPASWHDDSAEALAVLCAALPQPPRPARGRAARPTPFGHRLDLVLLADRWIAPLDEAARQEGLHDTLGTSLHRLLRDRRGTAGPALWTGRDEDLAVPSFLLNLPAFFSREDGLDVAALGEAVSDAVLTLTLAAPAARRIAVAPTGLAGLLAMAGIAYDSQAARDTARCLMAFIRACADQASAHLARSLGGGEAASSAVSRDIPPQCTLPGLAEAARQACAAAPRSGLRHRATTAILPPHAAEALLGVHTSGIAPSFSPLASDGGLSEASRLWLLARGLRPEEAVAAMVRGETVFPQAGTQAHAAMHDAVAPFLHMLPARPEPQQDSAETSAPHTLFVQAEELPARRSGYTQRAMVGGHTVFLRTGEYADGRLGEIAVSLPKDSPMARGLMECLAQAISLGLQHGVKPDKFIEALAMTSFGPAGAVEGDPSVERATSIPDYIMRHLAVSYTQRALPPAPAIETQESDHTAEAGDPLLPLDLPQAARKPLSRPRRRGLRLVNG